MIDPADKQTHPLPLGQPKRGRGRPATGKALSDAERARRYRANKKKRDDQASQKDAPSIPADGVKEILDGWQRTQDELDQALQRIVELEAELASRVTEKDEDNRGVWVVQVKRRGSRTWKECGNPEVGLEMARKNVDYMQFKSGTGQGEEWRAIRADGMIYWPLWAKAKAPKSGIA
ncbi:hypothetical protein MMZ02_33250 [Pseudomonas aeruginosa]|uniref:hypothetical protein n=1 Tax=Pseudomonas aeruginosa TaxID=287 RepID=UPI001F0C9EA2|nr:hypothetical protein [Pseudomonas aeruginosa]MCP9256782.1 hypothetical protein [Pseudomonas aeruginosa]